jgi:glycosyltransferase involved in cell wall biosynthesis
MDNPAAHPTLAAVVQEDSTPSSHRSLLSFVIPLLNERDNLAELHRRLVAVCDQIGCRRQILFVDDGSTDGSDWLIGQLAQGDPSVIGLRLSRNFGHEIATTAGLDHAEGDATILMDADLQDPPELVEEMVRQWRAGSEVVYARRRRREGETWFKKGSSWLFYRLINRLSDVAMPMDAGDFRLLDAKVVRALRRCREQDRFRRGLVAWAGFRSSAVPYDRPPRQGGKTHYNALKLLLLSLDAIVGFSITPLRFATAIGFLVTAVSLVVAGIVVLQKIFSSLPIQGYALLATGLFFLGGMQMLILGVLGEYLGRVYRQTQGRPLYLLAETMGTLRDERRTVRRDVSDGAKPLVVSGQTPDHPESAPTIPATD